VLQESGTGRQPALPGIIGYTGRILKQMIKNKVEARKEKQPHNSGEPARYENNAIKVHGWLCGSEAPKEVSKAIKESCSCNEI
jgi:hypothetical protein